MAWQDILSGEVDVNSPITSSLMNKIKGNLEWLKSALVGWCVANCWDEIIELNVPADTWTTIKTIKVYIPSWASKLSFRIRGKTGSGGTVKFRLKDADTSNKSDTTGTAGGSYAWLSADWQSPPTGWQSIDIQAYDTDGGNVYVGELAIIVSEVS